MTDALKLARETVALLNNLPSNKMTDGSPLAIVCRALLAAEAERERLAALVTRWEALGERHDLALRERGCQCQYEIGDSPCPIASHCAECMDSVKCAEHGYAQTGEGPATTDTERHDG